MKREKKRIKKLVPYGLWDFTGLQTWLNQQARAGYALAKWPGWNFIGLAYFEKDPSAVHARYCLDPIQKHFGEAQLAEQAARYRELGWNYVGKIWNSYAIYRCDDPQAPELYTDPDSLAWAMKKQVRLALLRPLFWLACFVLDFLYFWDGAALLHQREQFVMNVILNVETLIPLYAALLAMFLYALVLGIRTLLGVRRIRASLRRGEWPEARPFHRREMAFLLFPWLLLGVLLLILIPSYLFGVTGPKMMSGPEEWDFPHVILEEVLPAGAVFRPYNHQEMLSPNTFDHSLLAPEQYDVAQGGTVQVDGGPQQDTRLYQELIRARSLDLAQAVYQGQVAARHRILELSRLSQKNNAHIPHSDSSDAYDSVQEEVLSYPGLDGLTRFTYQYADKTTSHAVYMGWAGDWVFILNGYGPVDYETALALLTQRLAED